MEGRTRNIESEGTISDSYSWLEERRSPKVLEWVAERNQKTLDQLTADPRYKVFYNAALAIHTDSGNNAGALSEGSIHVYGGWVYSAWLDPKHPSGQWRRTRIESFRTIAPEWETLFDLSELIRREGKSWHIGFPVFSPFSNRCMIALVDGRRISWREFDLETKTFLKQGFITPAAVYSSVAWVDADSILIATDAGPGTLSAEGSPLTVRAWTRGQPLRDAQELFAAQPQHYGIVTVNQIIDADGKPSAFLRGQSAVDAHAGRFWVPRGNGQLDPVLLPGRNSIDTIQGTFHGKAIIKLDADWVVAGNKWTAGSLVAVPVAQLANANPQVEAISVPSTQREAIVESHVTRDGIIVHSAKDIRDEFWFYVPHGSTWGRRRIPVPEAGEVYLNPFTPSTSRYFFLTFQSPLQSPTLLEVDTATTRVVPLSYGTPKFSCAECVVEQAEATSSDGVRIPYIVVRAANLAFDGQAPTILRGYGALGVGKDLRYDGVLGRLWLEQGGVYVYATVRGGGELGPDWHVTRSQRQLTYDDFIAIAEDLIKRQITSPAHLGIEGYSAGGLLAGSVLVQRPELFNAAYLLCPLLDNFRLDLTNGASAASTEYGVPNDPMDLEFLARTSPFQNLKKKKNFPATFIFTNTNDTNVFPGMPRRFAAKLGELGLPYYYYEASTGGHGTGDKPSDFARADALVYVYFTRRLMKYQ